MPDPIGRRRGGSLPNSDVCTHTAAYDDAGAYDGAGRARARETQTDIEL